MECYNVATSDAHCTDRIICGLRLSSMVTMFVKRRETPEKAVSTRLYLSAAESSAYKAGVNVDESKLLHPELPGRYDSHRRIILLDQLLLHFQVGDKMGRQREKRCMGHAYWVCNLLDWTKIRGKSVHI